MATLRQEHQQRVFDLMRRSAGILMYKYRERELLVLLVHPGGPYWARKDSWKLVHPQG